MSTKTHVKTETLCDACGKSDDGQRPAGWIGINAHGGEWLMQSAFAGTQGSAVSLMVRYGDGKMASSARLDYCSAECAAKHLGGVAK